MTSNDANKLLNEGSEVVADNLKKPEGTMVSDLL